jgi:hypothetical protein
VVVTNRILGTANHHPNNNKLDSVSTDCSSAGPLTSLAASSVTVNKSSCMTEGERNREKMEEREGKREGKGERERGGNRYTVVLAAGSAGKI